MKAILCKTLPWTATLPTRLKVTMEGQKPFIISADSDRLTESNPQLSAMHIAFYDVWNFSKSLKIVTGQIKVDEVIGTLTEIEPIISSFVDMCGLNATDSYLLIGTRDNIKTWCDTEQRSYGYMHYVITHQVQPGVKTLSDRPIINVCNDEILTNRLRG